MKLFASLVKPAKNELTSAAIEAQLSVDAEFVNFASQVHTQRRGRPAFEIEEEQLIFLLDEGFNIPTTARLFRVSSRTVETVERRMTSMASLYQIFFITMPQEARKGKSRGETSKRASKRTLQASVLSVHCLQTNEKLRDKMGIHLGCGANHGCAKLFPH